ncbi:hypothetical protein D3C81_2328640 [compost metagenome]
MLGDPAQIFHRTVFLNHFAESVPWEADFLDWQAVARVDHGEPVDFVVDGIIENA